MKEIFGTFAEHGHRPHEVTEKICKAKIESSV